MERFYGKDHSVGLANEDADSCIRMWRDCASPRAHSAAELALVAWLDERLESRSLGTRGFRIAPAPEPIAAAATLDFFAEVVAECANRFASADAPVATSAGRRIWLARMLDLLAFVNQARNVPLDTDAPSVAEEDALDVTLHRMWDRFNEAARMEDLVFPDDPRYPDPARMLEYLDRILAIAEESDREQQREWPFPKILWEREILLEKLGRFDEMAATMRRSAALEDESFRRQTEEYIAVVVAN